MNYAQKPVNDQPGNRKYFIKVLKRVDIPLGGCLSTKRQTQLVLRSQNAAIVARDNKLLLWRNFYNISKNKDKWTFTLQHLSPSNCEVLGTGVSMRRPQWKQWDSLRRLGRCCRGASRRHTQVCVNMDVTPWRTCLHGRTQAGAGREGSPGGTIRE